jgi:threonine/homoserine/homoserine lactone efflux protein
MVPIDTWLLFALATVALAATPGPNLLYLLSRTLVQGRAAGFVSLAGTLSGLLFHVVAAALGLSALLAAVPAAFDAVRWAGALYLVWLAWQAWQAPVGDVAMAAGPARVPPFRLWRDGLVTGILNPKVALFQLALFPQFVDPAHGSVLGQSLVLGATQLAIVGLCDGGFIAVAANVGGRLRARPGFVRWSRRVLAGVFAGLAARLAVERAP